MNKHVEEGTLRLEWRDFTHLGRESVNAASGGALRGAILLAVYAAGMAAPLFLMALLWDRFDLGSRRWLRGREISMGRLRLHTTNLISGAMFALLGALFIAFDGATDLAFAAQQWASNVARGIPGEAILAVLAALGAALLLLRRRRGGSKDDSGDGAYAAKRDG